MPKALAKSRAKKAPAKKKPPQTSNTYERMRKATRPSKSKKPTAQRMREATGVRHKPQRRRTMPETQSHPTQQTQQPRGAGSGEKANATRSRDPKDTADVDESLTFAKGKDADDYKPEAYKEGKEFPEGEADKGKLDFRTASQASDPNLHIAHRDRRAYLVDQAEKNEAANDELNAIQVEQNKRVQLASNLINDPDYQRDSSMESAKAALEMHNPDKIKERLKGEMDARRKRDKAQVEAAEGKK